MNSPPSRSTRENFVLILTLGILNALTPFTIDMYLPAFPDLANDFGVSVSQVALSVSVYFIGFALGQIFYGPLLDRFGRKPPIYAGLVLYVLATLGCMQAETLPELLIFRFLSATGGCAASVGATAMVRDFFPREAAAKVFSLMMLVLSASPLLAPSVGSLVVTVASWRTIFGILAVMGTLNLLLVAFVLPVGYRSNPAFALRLGPILSNYWSVLRNRQFATYVFAGSFSFSGLFVYIAGSPAIFMEGYRVSAQTYGAIFAFLAGGMIGGGQLNLLLMRRFRDRQIFRYALSAQVVVGSVFFLGSWFGLYGIWATVALLFLYLSCAGVTYPNAAALALGPFTENIGSASALLGFLQLGVGAITSAGVGLLQMPGGLATATAMGFASWIGWLILTFAGRFKPIAAGEP